MAKKYIVRQDEREFEVTVVEHEGAYEVQYDDKTLLVDSKSAPGSPTRSLLIDGRAYEASTLPGRDGLEVFVSGDAFLVRVTNELWARAEAESGGGAGGGETVESPMPGSVVKILVEEGQVVESGEPVAIVEAMKMQNEIAAIRGGKVTSVPVEAGKVVEQGTPLVVLGPLGETE